MLDKLKEYFATKKVEKAIKNSPIHQVAIQAGIKANKETGLDRLAEKSEKVRRKCVNFKHVSKVFEHF